MYIFYVFHLYVDLGIALIYYMNFCRKKNYTGNPR